MKRCGGVEGVRLTWGDKEVTRPNLVAKMVMEMLVWLLDDMWNTTLFYLLDFSIHNLHWFFYKVEFVIESKLFHWNDERFEALVFGIAQLGQIPFNDFDGPMYQRVKLSSSLIRNDETDNLYSLQAFWGPNLQLFLGGFMNYFGPEKFLTEMASAIRELFSFGMNNLCKGFPYNLSLGKGWESAYLELPKVKYLSDKTLDLLILKVDSIVPTFLKEPICMTNYRYWLLIASSSWSFVYVVSGQMTHLVASITLDSARPCVMLSAFFTQGTIFSIPIVFSWGGSISPEGFLSSVLLWLVIIVAIVGVGVTVVVVVVESSSVVKLLFVIT
ncbi:hypothetical protein Tco_1229191 [Tanacetum coccineum]